MLNMTRDYIYWSTTHVYPSLYGPGAPLHDPRVHGKFLAMLDAYNQGSYILEYYPIFTPVCMALERLYMIPEYMVSSWLS